MNRNYLFNKITYRLFNYIWFGRYHNMWTLHLAYQKALKAFDKTEVLPPSESTGEKVHNSSVRINKTIWVFWNKGFDNAPDIVKICLRSLKRNKGDYDLVCLTNSNLTEYVKLPEYIIKKRNSGKLLEAQFADLIRLQLLIQYGGCWLDVTCLLTATIPESVSDAGVFMFQTLNWENNLSPIRCSNWFISGKQGNILLIKLRNCLFNYHYYNDKPFHYFIFHLFLAVLINRDKECNEIWESMPFMNNTTPHVLQFSLSNPY